MRLDSHSIQLVVPPFEVDDRSREERHGGFQHLIGARAALRLVYAAGFELRSIPAGTDAVDVAVAREILECRDLLSEDRRRAYRQDEDRGAEANPFRDRRDV